MLKHPPRFLIIGAARSGTSALASYLEQHPAIAMTRPKETNFFAFANQTVDFRGPGDEDMINSRTTTDPEAFDALLGQHESRPVCGEGSVSTLYYSNRSIPNIQKYAPAAKLIVILRHPVERAFSNYQYMRSKGFEPCENFLDTLDREDERIASNWHHIWHYTRMGFYSESLSAFRANFPESQLLVTYYDDFQQDATAVVRRVLQFIGLNDDFDLATDLRVNRSGTPRNKLLGTLLQNDLARRVGRTVIPFTLREKVRNAVLKPADVAPVAREHLVEVYRSEIARLRSMLTDLPESW